MQRLVVSLCVLALSYAVPATAGPQDDLVAGCMKCDLAKAEAALAGGADPKALHASGQNMLALACLCPEVTSVLLAKGVSPDEGNYPALVSAANNYMVDVMKLLLEAGATPSKAASTGMSPIFAVVQQTNCVPCLQMLLDKGVDANGVNAEGVTPVQVLASFAMDRAGRKAAFATGATIMRDRFGMKVPDFLAALPDELNGTSVDMLNALIAKGADVNRVAPDGNTPLIMALRGGKGELALALLKGGADPKVRAKVSLGGQEVVYDPLAAAATKGTLDVVTALVEKGVDLDFGSQSASIATYDGTFGGEGYTPLILAIQAGKVDIAGYLVEKGASLTIGTEGFSLLKNARTSMECLASVSNKLPIYFAIEAGDLALVTTIADRMKAGPFEPRYTIQQWGGGGGKGNVSTTTVCSFARSRIKPSEWADQMEWPEAKALLEARDL